MNHLAIIPDGNRRWERLHNLPEGAGHAQAFTVHERICDWCLDNNIKYLTMFCFSTDNWKRPQEEIDHLFGLAEDYIVKSIDWYRNRGIRIIFQGRRDRVKKRFTEIMRQTEEATKNGQNLILFLLIDYGGQEEIRWAFENNIDLESLRPHVDCIVRTSGEKRLSNFLTWNSAYAELIFRDEYFPDIDYKIMDMILAEYQQRDIRYGK